MVRGGRSQTPSASVPPRPRNAQSSADGTASWLVLALQSPAGAIPAGLFFDQNSVDISLSRIARHHTAGAFTVVIMRRRIRGGRRAVYRRWRDRAAEEERGGR
jgi:hypothetical protein